MKTRAVFAVVFTPIAADHPAEREIVLFERRRAAERMQAALVERCACTIGKRVFTCKSGQGVYVETREVFCG